MARNEVNELQLKVIEAIVEGKDSIVDICKMYKVSRGTYYDWKKKDYFNKALNEYLEAKKYYAIDQLKDKVEDFLDRLEDLSKKSKNDMVKLQATRELLGHSGMIVGTKDEGNKEGKDESGYKNFLKDMLKVKKKA